MDKVWMTFWICVAVCFMFGVGAATLSSLEEKRLQNEIVKEAMKQGYVEEPIGGWSTDKKWIKKESE